MDNKILEAKEEIRKLLKKCEVYGCEEEEFFRNIEDEDFERFAFDLEAYGIPYLFITLINEKLESTDCWVQIDLDDEETLNLSLVRKK